MNIYAYVGRQIIVRFHASKPVEHSLVPIPKLIFDLSVKDKENLSILLKAVLHLYLTSPYTLAIHVFSL